MACLSLMRGANPGSPNQTQREEEKRNQQFIKSINCPALQRSNWLNLNELTCRATAWSPIPSTQPLSAFSSFNEESRSRSGLVDSIHFLLLCWIGIVSCCCCLSSFRGALRPLPPLTHQKNKQHNSLHPTQPSAANNPQFHFHSIAVCLGAAMPSPIHQTIIHSILKEMNEMFDWIWRWAAAWYKSWLFISAAPTVFINFINISLIRQLFCFIHLNFYTLVLL